MALFVVMIPAGINATKKTLPTFKGLSYCACDLLWLKQDQVYGSKGLGTSMHQSLVSVRCAFIILCDLCASLWFCAKDRQAEVDPVGLCTACVGRLLPLSAWWVLLAGLRHVLTVKKVSVVQPLSRALEINYCVSCLWAFQGKVNLISAHFIQVSKRSATLLESSETL